MAKEDIAGIAITKLGDKMFTDNYDKRVDPRGKVYYWLAGELVKCDEDDGTEETPPVDCGSHGTWNKSLNKCQCNTGWSGTICDKSINDNCEANGHYYVNSRGLCVCKEGFGGLNCDQDPREVCNNRGTWNACGGGCTCESGFMGTYCQKEITSDKYCNNGTWINSEWGNNGYCQCNTGYAGKDCSITQEEANA